MWAVERYTAVLGAKLLAFLVAFRTLNALVVRTSFTPDEFWQGPEPAHLLAFGTGHLTWEWQPSARIRGFTHPVLFSALYNLLQIMGLDTRWAVAHSPKILQGIAAGVCDYFTFGLTLRAFGATAAGWALLFQVLSWFNFYCLVRPYSNSAEAVLATAALYFWAPFILPATATSSRGRKRGGSGGVAAAAADSGVEKAQGMESEGAGPVAVSGSRMTSSAMETVALLLAAFCVAVRPTSAALWTVVGLLRLSALPLRRWPRYLALQVFPPVIMVVGASVYLDSRMYGALTLVPLNFLRFNVLEGKSRIFGEQAWHWNFSQGLPAVLGAALPATLIGFWRPSGIVGGWVKDEGTGDRRLGWLAVWFLVYHSTSPHKEFRFLLPVLPIAHAYAGQAVSAFLAARDDSGKASRPATRSTDTAIPITEIATKEKAAGTSVLRKTEKTRESASATTAASSRGTLGNRKRLRVLIAGALTVLHVPAAIYLSVWHQSGALSAVDAVALRIPDLVLAKQAEGDPRGRAGKERESQGDIGDGDGVYDGDGGKVVVAVHFLMPCHATPLHSHLHFRGLEIALWSLDCSPKNRELPHGAESDRFQTDPLEFLESTYGGVEGDSVGVRGDVFRSPPDLAVMYDTHLDRPGVAEYLIGLGLEVQQVVFNAHVNGDADSEDMHRSVAVLQRNSNSCGKDRLEEGSVGFDKDGSCAS